jgi:hypothetical protein
LKVEIVALIVRAVCTALAFSFAFLSFQAANEVWKRQFAVMAASPLVVGVIILAFLGVYWKMKTT